MAQRYKGSTALNRKTFINYRTLSNRDLISEQNLPGNVKVT